MPILLLTAIGLGLVGLVILAIGVVKSRNSVEEEDPPVREDYMDSYDYSVAHNQWQARRDATPYPLRLIGAGVLALAALTFLATLMTVVPSQSVGVVTSFNKPTGRTLESGLHFKAPWHKVHDMDGTVQLIDNIGSGSDDPDDSDNARTEVRIAATNATMFVDNAFRWKIKTEAAPALYLDWRKGGGNIVEKQVSNGLVEKELAAAMNVALADYDPYAGNRKGQTVDDLQQEVTRILVGGIDPVTKQPVKGKIGDRVEVVSFSIILIDFDQGTKDQIRQIQDEVQRTKQSAQKKLTAENEAEVNRKLAASVSKDPNVLVSKCLDAQQKLIDKWSGTEGNPLQGVPSCWPINGVQTVRPVQ